MQEDVENGKDDQHLASALQHTVVHAEENPEEIERWKAQKGKK